MAITRRITTSTSEPLYNEGDVIVKSTNGLPTYGMTEADMQAAQAAQASPQAAQLAAEIVNAARNGNIAPQGNVSPQGGVVTYGGGQRGGVTVLPDIRGDGDGVWLANMAPGRPIDLGPTAGWAGFNGQGQFVGYPSGMPHVLYGGFMDTLAPFMQYLSPMFQQARANVSQAPAAHAAPATPGRTRRQDTTPVDDTPVTTGPVSRDLNDNAWSVRPPAVDWIEEAKRNIAGVDENGNPILDLESIKPPQDLIMTGPRGNVIRFTPETTQERHIQQYSAPSFDTAVDIPTMEIPDYVEPTGDIDWSTAIGTGGTAGFTEEIPDVSPEVAQNAMSQLSLLSSLLSGIGWAGVGAKGATTAARAAGAAGASALARRLGLGKGKPNVRTRPQSNAADPYKAPEQMRAPTAVRTDVPVSTPAASPASLAERMRMAPPGSMPPPFQTPTDMWRNSYWMPEVRLSPAAQAAARQPVTSVPTRPPFVGPPTPPVPASMQNPYRFVGPMREFPGPPRPAFQPGIAQPADIIRPSNPIVSNWMGPPVPPLRFRPNDLVGPPKPFVGPRPRRQMQLVRPEPIDRVVTQPTSPSIPLNAPDEFGRYAPIIRTTPPRVSTTTKSTTKPVSKAPAKKKTTTRKKKAD